MALQPSEIIVLCLLACALIGVPAVIGYFVFGLLRREPPTDPIDVPEPVDAETERVGAVTRHGRRRPNLAHNTRRPGLDLRNRFRNR